MTGRNAITITDNQTGAVARGVGGYFVDDFSEADAFWWEEGNGASDNNRANWLGQGWERPDTYERYWVKIEGPDGSVLYEEEPK